MSKITATTRFRHGPNTYEPGTEHDVPPVLAGYFVANGWATSDDPEITAVVAPAPAAVTLEVDSVIVDGTTDPAA